MSDYTVLRQLRDGSQKVKYSDGSIVILPATAAAPVAEVVEVVFEEDASEEEADDHDYDEAS